MNTDIKPSRSDNSNTGDISEKSVAVPDLDGRDVIVELFCYPELDEGAFVGIQNATTLAHGVEMVENTTLRGAEAVQLGLHLIAAGRRALELEAAR